jgi:hypothetical protein
MQRSFSKINLKLLDFDRCLGAVDKNNENFDLDDPVQYREWLLQNNKAFLNQLVEEIKAGNYDLIIIGNGSNREDYDIDILNKGIKCNGSFAWMLPIVQSYLAAQLNGKVTVVFDPFILADIYGKNKKAGDSYKAILKTLMGDKDQIHSKFMFAENKIPLMYAFAHRVAALNHAQIDKLIWTFMTIIFLYYQKFTTRFRLIRIFFPITSPYVYINIRRVKFVTNLKRK